MTTDTWIPSMKGAADGERRIWKPSPEWTNEQMYAYADAVLKAWPGCAEALYWQAHRRRSTCMVEDKHLVYEEDSDFLFNAR